MSDWIRIPVRVLDTMEGEPVRSGERVRAVERIRSEWDRPIEQGNLRFQARQGTRAAVYNLGDGLYIVGEVPERSTREVGFLPLLAPLLVRESLKRLNRRQAPAGRGESALAWVRNAASKAGLKVTGKAVNVGGDIQRAVAAPEWATEATLVELGYCTCNLRRT